MKDTVVLYHRGCNDGIAAAWAAKTRFGDNAKYIPWQYGEDLPPETFGNHVIMVDLSLKPEQFEKAAQEIETLLIIDHHKSAAPLQNFMAPVKTYDDYIRARANGGQGFIFFDMEYSGAMLSWAFFNNVTDLSDVDAQPHALRLIQDYDLWTHELEDTKAVNAWLINGGLTISRVDELMSRGSDQIPEHILAIGRALLKYDDKIIKSVLREYVQPIELPGGVRCALVNGPHHLRNALADHLSDKYDFVALYTVRKDRTVYSLRSKGFDVSKIAESFGGGGHKEAAAFSLPNHLVGLHMGQEAFSRPTLLTRVKAAWNILTAKVNL